PRRSLESRRRRRSGDRRRAYRHRQRAEPGRTGAPQPVLRRCDRTVEPVGRSGGADCDRHHRVPRALSRPVGFRRRDTIRALLFVEWWMVRGVYVGIVLVALSVASGRSFENAAQQEPDTQEGTRPLAPPGPDPTGRSPGAGL